MLRVLLVSAAIRGGQHPRGNLLTVAANRYRFGRGAWRPRVAVFSNAWPTAINRADRATIGVWYFVIELGPFVLDFYGRSRRRVQA